MEIDSNCCECEGSGSITLTNFRCKMEVERQAELENSRQRKAFEKAGRLYELGLEEEAVDAFESAIGQMPRSEIVYAWLKGNGEDRIFEMLNSENGRVADIARRMLEMAQPATHCFCYRINCPECDPPPYVAGHEDQGD